MFCPIHPHLNCLSQQCVKCKTFEKKMLMLGPRRKDEYFSLLKVYDIAPEIQIPFINKKDKVYEHVVYTVAKNILKMGLGPVNVFDFFQNNPNHAAWILRNAETHLADYIQLVGETFVKAKTPLGLHDIKTLEKKAKEEGIKGLRIDQVAGEYDDAFSDVQTLIQKKILLATDTHIWHRDNVALE